LADDLGRSLAFYRFPEGYRAHLRTSDVTESMFASVRLRTNAPKRFQETRSGVYLMYEVMRRLQARWRRLTSAHLCATVPLPGKQTRTRAA
jgi:transposase-like protein